MSGAEQLKEFLAEKQPPLAVSIPFKIALSIKEVEHAIGLGHTQTYAEINSGRLKTYKRGNRRFSTPDWVREWQADVIAESE